MMTAPADGAPSANPGRPRSAGQQASTPPQPVGADKQLHAQNSDRVYQAAGNQYIYEQRSPVLPAVTNTLPRSTAAFTGRQAELRKLIDAVSRAADAGEPIAIHVIDGMPGVGKTAFAVRAGHLLARRFPDGQLFVDLHAHTPSHRPADPADVLFALLSVDGMHPDQIPSGLDERAARWRARIANKKLLIIMDNAADHQQIEPLLPGAAGSLVLITSRRRLTGLRVRHAAEALPLETLPPDEAAALFARLTGRRSTEVESAAVAELVRLCGYLPLAISLLAAKLRPEPLWTVTDLLDEMSATQDRLTHLRAENIAVAAAFDLSYHKLPAAQRRFFRRLGLHPGIDVDVYAAAAIDNTSLHKARQHLDTLYHDHLLDQPVRGRYRMHDLIRDYARAHAAKDHPATNEQAIHRLLDYYRQLAGVANGQITGDPQVPGSPSRAKAPEPPVSGLDRAMSWLRTELPNLLACAAYAREHDEHTYVIGMADVLASFLSRTGPWHQAIALHRAAVSAAQRLGDRRAEANALRAFGVGLRRTGNYAATRLVFQQTLTLYADLADPYGQAALHNEIAIMHSMVEEYPPANRALRNALGIYTELDDRLGIAETLSNLAVVRYLTDNHSGATEALRESTAIYRQLGNRPGLATALFRLGLVRCYTDDYPGATEAFGEALAIYQDLGDRLGQANVRQNLGVVRRMTDDHRAAADDLQAALTWYEELGDRLGQANTYKHLGIVRRLTGDLPAAASALRDALAIYQELGDRLGQAATLSNLALVVWRLDGDFNQAVTLLERAISIYRRLGARHGQAQALNHLGTILLEHDEGARGLTQHEQALRFAREANSPIEEARAYEGAARCARHERDMDSANGWLRQALEIYRRIGSPRADRIAAELEP